MLTPDDDGGAAGNDRGRHCRRRPWGLSVTIPTPNADDYAKVDHDGNIWVAPGRFSLRPSSWINGSITAPILPNPAAASRYLGGMLTPQPRRWRPGQAVALAMEPQSSRMLQKCLEEGGIQEFDLMFQEVLTGFPTLAGHAFGNYLCQKLIDKSPPEHRALILRRLAGSIARLSVDVHGTRVIQNLIELCTTPEETALITLEFKGLAVALARHCYGSHCLERCLQASPSNLVPPELSLTIANRSTHDPRRTTGCSMSCRMNVGSWRRTRSGAACSRRRSTCRRGRCASAWPWPSPRTQRSCLWTNGGITLSSACCTLGTRSCVDA